MPLPIRCLRLALPLAVLMGIPGWTIAGAPRALPVFELKDLQGEVVSSSALVQEGKWVLVYVGARCSPCEAILRELKKDDVEPGRIAILVSGTVDDAASLARRYPDLAGAGWYVDPLREGFSALKLTGVPVTRGLLRQNVVWSFSGVLSSSQDLKSIIASWLAE